MIIDLLNFHRYYPGTEANILFRLQEEGISVPPFFCITEDFNEDELNSYLQNHFQYTELFALKLSFSFEEHGNKEINDTVYESQFLIDIPKSALAYSAEKLFSQSKDYIAEHYTDEKAKRCSAVHIIIREKIEMDLKGIMHTVCRNGLMNETIVYTGTLSSADLEFPRPYTSIYCHNNTDGILYYFEPDGADKASIAIVKKLLDLSEKIKSIFNYKALEIKYVFNTLYNKIFILSVTRYSKFDYTEDEEIVLDTKGVCNYYPGVTEPLYAYTAIEMSGHTTEKMMATTGQHSSSANSQSGIIEYVNGRLYFNIKKLSSLQNLLSLTDESEKYIDPGLIDFAAQVKECGSFTTWRKKRRAAARMIKLLEENLKESKSLCDKCSKALKELSKCSYSNEGYEPNRRSIEIILTVISECINSNQLNTLYINFNKRLKSRLRPTERKYAKAERSIALALRYRTELRRYHYSFLKFLRIYSLNLGHDLVNKGIIDNPDDISMLTYKEVIAPEVPLTADIKTTIEKRKKEFEWYRSMPNFSRLVFFKEIESAPVGKIDAVCAVSDESHIRGCGLNMEKAELPAVLCRDNVLPKKCDPEKIYVIDKFTEFSEKNHMGGLIIMQKPILANSNPDLIKVSFPVICGAEHALSVISNGDLVSMDSSNGEIFIKHQK